MNSENRKREASPEVSEAERESDAEREAEAKREAEVEKMKKITERYRQLLREVQLNPERINTDPAFQELILVWIPFNTFDWGLGRRRIEMKMMDNTFYFLSHVV